MPMGEFMARRVRARDKRRLALPVAHDPSPVVRVPLTLCKRAFRRKVLNEFATPVCG